MEIKIVRQVLEWNQNCHDELRKYFDSKNVLVINLMGSPGCGKTTLLMKMIDLLRKDYKIGVIEADIADKIDAEKISNAGIPVVQLNTDGACHIEAMSIKNIIPLFNFDNIDILFIENIGNLVCPAEFDIGEDKKVAILSVPEGDDKIRKYPLMFKRADALVINKYDMMEYFDFDMDRINKDARTFNENLEIFKTDSKHGDGIEELYRWIKKYIKK